MPCPCCWATGMPWSSNVTISSHGFDISNISEGTLTMWQQLFPADRWVTTYLHRLHFPERWQGLSPIRSHPPAADAGQRKISLYPNFLTLGLVKVRCKHGVQYWLATPVYLLMIIQLLLGSIQEVQRCRFIPLSHQLRCNLESMAQVVALCADHILGCLDCVHSALQR